MREIKFRAFDDEKCELVKWEDLSINNTGAYMYGDEIVKVGDGLLMQYTGLKDKNGVEIYEGDIVRSIPRGEKDEALYKVFYDSTYCSFCGEFIKYINLGIGNRDNFPLGEIRFNVEVIGNIYENNELLND